MLQHFIFHTWGNVGYLWPINDLIFHCHLHSLSSFIGWNQILKNEEGILINDEGIILMKYKKLISENLLLCFQTNISFSSYLWQIVENIPFLGEKFINFCRLTPFFLKNGHAPKIFFLGHFGKYCSFFFEKINKWKYSEPHFLQESYINFCRQTPSFFRKGLGSAKKIFVFSSENTIFFWKNIWK